jgi:hypothetical protein
MKHQFSPDKMFSLKAKEKIKKIGFAGFLFFLLKGIAWLVFGYLLIE